MKKNDKSHIIIFLIFAAIVIIIVGILLILFDFVVPKTKDNNASNKDKIQDNSSNFNSQKTIASPEDVIELLSKTRMRNGYSFVHKKTEGSKIIIEQINNKTDQVLNEYIFDTEKNEMMVKTYGTVSSSVKTE